MSQRLNVAKANDLLARITYKPGVRIVAVETQDAYYLGDQHRIRVEFSTDIDDADGRPGQYPQTMFVMIPARSVGGVEIERVTP